MGLSRNAPFVLDAVEEFLRTKNARSRKTQAAYSGILLGSTRGTKPALGIPFASFFINRRFGTVTHDDVATWFAQRVQGGAQATKHRVSKNTRQFLRFAKERGYTELDLSTAIDPYKAGGPRVEYLEWTEIHSLLDAIPEDRYRLAAAWLFYTGCRVGEACRAIQADVRWKSDARFFTWTIHETKTHVPRTVWLPDELAALVRTSRDRNNPAPDWPILWDCAGHGFGRVENPAFAISARTINSALERAREAINLPIHVTAHTAKHSYCTNWVRSFGSGEINLEKLSRQVGTSVGVLRSTYIHFDLTANDWELVRKLGTRGAA